MAILIAALFLAVFITAATETPKCAYAGCGSGTTWNIWSETTDSQSNSAKGGQTTGTEDISSHSVQHSDDGQTFDDTQTHHKNADGSSTDHEETHYEDQFGNGCSSDGEPVTEDRTVDDETDKDGNHKQHIEVITQKNGKCMKSVRDREWDRKGKLIKDTGWKETEIPCVKYYLEVTKAGTISVKGGSTVQFGPDTARMPLGLQDGTYTGSYTGKFNSTISGECSGSYTYPISIEAIAKGDESGDLEFSVGITTSGSGYVACSSSHEGTMPAKINTYTFTLPFEDGASKVYTVSLPAAAGSGELTYTFTLKKKAP